MIGPLQRLRRRPNHASPASVPEDGTTNDRATGRRASRVTGGLLGRPLIVIGVVTIVAVLAGVFGTSAPSKMSEDIGNPHAESAQALVDTAKHAGFVPDQAVAVVVKVPDGYLAASSQRRIGEVVKTLGTVKGIAQVLPPQASPKTAVSTNGKLVLVTAMRRAGVDSVDLGKNAVAAFKGQQDVTVGGTAVINETLSTTIGRDLGRAETLVFPLLVVLCIWIFRGVYPSLLTVGTGGLVILFSMLVLRVAVEFTDISTYVMNLVIGLGLGLSIDYSLLFISRYREEVSRSGYSGAVAETLRTAGHTIWFSAITVAASMSTLLIFPQTFLRSMGIGGVSATLLSAACTTTLLPAVLTLTGRYLEFGTPRFLRARMDRETATDAHSWWYHFAHWQMRRPVPVLVGCLVMVAILASPLAHIHFGDTDASTLSQSTSARQVDDLVKKDFPHGKGGELLLVAHASSANQAAVHTFYENVRGTPNVTVLARPSYVGGNIWLIRLVTESTPYSSATRRTIVELRALTPGFRVQVGGPAASFADLVQDVKVHLPWALSLAAIVVMVVMFILTGSVLLPIKQLLMNLASVAATLGVLTWIFQQGHLEGLFGFTSNGFVDLLQPILVIIIAFGLSTDYGVIILARIREAHRRTGDNVEAVAEGIGHTGRIVTSAAILLVVAIGAFSTSSITFIKTLGVGSALAVGLDAFFIRPFVVPAAMKLLGDLNWWAPAPLARLHRRIDIAEAAPADEPPADEPATTWPTKAKPSKLTA